MVFKRRESLGEHAEVFDMEMVGLHAAVLEAWDYINDMNTASKLTNIIYANNAAAIRRIFEGTPGVTSIYMYPQLVSSYAAHAKLSSLGRFWCWPGLQESGPVAGICVNWCLPIE